MTSSSCGITSIGGAPLEAQETTACLLLHPVARACAPSEKKNILQSQQESPREVTEPACRTDQVGCPSSFCSLASSVTSTRTALGALWCCHLSCPLLQLLLHHHPHPSCQLDLFLPLLYLHHHLQLHCPVPFASITSGCPLFPSIPSPSVSGLSPEIHPLPLSSLGPSLCPHQMQLCHCISLTFSLLPSPQHLHPHHPVHIIPITTTTSPPPSWFIALFPSPHQPGPIHCP